MSQSVWVYEQGSGQDRSTGSRVLHLTLPVEEDTSVSGWFLLMEFGHPAIRPTEAASTEDNQASRHHDVHP
jgi:hypothetical protein